MNGKVSIINDNKKIASIIKELRKQRKITQTELADYAGLSRAGIAKIESGASDIKLSTLISIINLLGFDLYLRDRSHESGE